MSRSINQSVRVQAPLAEIFKAFTDAEQMERWWPSAVESDPKTGGSFKYTFAYLDPAEPAHERAGQYASVVPGQSIAYPWNIPGMEPSTNVAIQFSSDGDETVVALEHTGWPADEAANEVFEMHDKGWAGFLSNLKVVYEGGDDFRAAAMKMKTTG